MKRFMFLLGICIQTYVMTHTTALRTVAVEIINQNGIILLEMRSRVGRLEKVHSVILDDEDIGNSSSGDPDQIGKTT